MSRDMDNYRKWARERFKRMTWPKCNDCGFIARRFEDFGCLNCEAIRQPSRAWTQPEEDTIETHAGKEGPTHLQYRLYQETGIPRSRDSLRKKIADMGIRVLEHQDAYTIADLMQITGRTYGGIKNLIDNGFVENIGKGRRILISLEDGEKVISRWKVPEQPSYSMQEAADLLGFEHSAIRGAVRRGLPSWKRGHTRLVCKVTIDRAVQHLRETGKIKVPWRSLGTT